MGKLKKFNNGDFIEITDIKGAKSLAFIINKRPNCTYGYNEVWIKRPLYKGHNVLYSSGKGGHEYIGGEDKISLSLPHVSTIKKVNMDIEAYKKAIMSLPKGIKGRLVVLYSKDHGINLHDPMSENLSRIITPLEELLDNEVNKRLRISLNYPNRKSL